MNRFDHTFKTRSSVDVEEMLRLLALRKKISERMYSAVIR